MIKLSAKSEKPWVEQALAALREEGFCLVEEVIGETQLELIRAAMYRVQERIHNEIGEDRLRRAGERGVLRLMCKLDPVFLDLLRLPELLAVVDGTVSPTAILHLQNGFILPPSAGEAMNPTFQTSFHRDFPRYLNGYVASVNVLLAIDSFSRANGATVVVPGSHQKPTPPSQTAIASRQLPVECEAGTMVVFDSTLWHAAGNNVSGKDRLAINHQFTRSWIKQQIDYVRALGDEAILALPPRSRQLLGYYTRVVTSLDEYYRPEERRLYRRGQG